ncbi:uncharacterized protein LOC135161100 [Diachasmimorpha longicaudata]|uniref:uncharacterized protein LOC135161100 n=1 Tax=Diachasmimorpha longicaudata TaxID=58733 RepID=UPI0030B8762D
MKYFPPLLPPFGVYSLQNIEYIVHTLHYIPLGLSRSVSGNTTGGHHYYSTAIAGILCICAACVLFLFSNYSRHSGAHIRTRRGGDRRRRLVPRGEKAPPALYCHPAHGD